MYLLTMFGALFYLSSVNALRQQTVGVRGQLMCGDVPLSGTKVKLWDEDTGPDPDDLLASGLTDSMGKFQLSGTTMELTNIDPRFKVYHDCDDRIMPCQRKVVFEIPDAYINSGTAVGKWFDIGVINMQLVFRKEERDCTN